ncbi:MAG: SLC13 family permease [Acidobacteriota bacterium]
MDLAWISLAALLVAILVSCTTKVNVGFLSLVLAWIIGVYVGGMKVSEITAGFPAQLFLTLAGVTLLFAEARVNGTLDRVAHRAVSTCRGNVGLIPVVFFFIALGLASIGAGNIASAALIAPMAMATAGRVGISAFLITIMVGNGANAGSLSPFAPTGIIVNGLMDRLGLGGAEWQSYFNNLIAHASVGFAGYFIFGGWRLFSRTYSEPQVSPETLNPVSEHSDALPASEHSFQPQHWVTLSVIGLLIVGVIFFDVNVGMGAFAGAVLLILLRITDEVAAVRAMPWGPILMVCGVTVLIGLLEKTGGLDLFTAFLARFSTQESVTGVVAFVTGLISAYSSTSGVVLPAFLPTVPGLIEKLGGGDPLAVASAMNVGAHLVDVSPLSTIGALCVAAAPAKEDYRTLFNKVLAWGLSMSVVGALLCYIFFGLLW